MIEHFIGRYARRIAAAVNNAASFGLVCSSLVLVISLVFAPFVRAGEASEMSSLAAGTNQNLTITGAMPIYTSAHRERQFILLREPFNATCERCSAKNRQSNR